MVGLDAERSLNLVVGMLATLKAARAYLPLDPAIPRERLEHRQLARNVVALPLNVDFSNASILKPGLEDLKLKNTKLAGSTVAQALTLANQVLGGGALPAGVNIGDLNTSVKTINENYDKGTTDKGSLIP